MSRRFFLAWSWTVIILILCWLPRTYIPDEDRVTGSLFIPNIDKLVHSGIFAIFAFLWMSVSQNKHRVWWVVLGGLALATISELVQNTRVVNRDGNFADGLADMLGVGVGLFGYFLYQRFQVNRTTPVAKTLIREL